MRYTLHFDGSCYQNPGGICAYGFHVDTDEIEPKRVHEGYGRILDDVRTNNVAEFEGVIHALDWFIKNVNDSEHLTIFGDSDMVISSIKRNKRSKKEHMLRLQDCAQSLIASLECDWTAKRIHRSKNKVADELAGRTRKALSKLKAIEMS